VDGSDNVFIQAQGYGTDPRAGRGELVFRDRLGLLQELLGDLMRVPELRLFGLSVMLSGISDGSLSGINFLSFTISSFSCTSPSRSGSRSVRGGTRSRVFGSSGVTFR
jgi:hypothetical protein